LGRIGKVGADLSVAQNRIENWFCILSAGIIAGMMVITVADVICRRVLNYHIKGSYEYVSLLFVYLIFFGLAYAQRQDKHITIGILYDRLPRKARKPIEGVILIISFILFAAITWYSGKSALFAYYSHDTVLGVVQVITWPSRFGVPIGSGILALRFLTQIIRLVRRGELFEETAVKEEGAAV